ncbi:MAG: hypothetical protein D6689_15755, partial [Deltaproteobacteria bacterium]
MGAAVAAALVALGALAAGVLIGRYYVPDDRELRRAARHARSFARALNFVLARDRDAAVDELMRVVDDNVSDLEPYFALGALFRSRGEWERAIRVHQALELRPEADVPTRARALYELALDFRAAGMPRRAIRAMEQVLALDAGHDGAVRALCALYEQQGLYAEAARAWERVAQRGADVPRDRLGHLWAAAARAAAAAGDVGEARAALREAERYAPGTPPVASAAIAVAVACGDERAAAKRAREALVRAPHLAEVWVAQLEACERRVARTEAEPAADAQAAEQRAADVDRVVSERLARAIAEAIAEAGPQPDLLLARARVRADSDPAAAWADARAAVSARPDDLAARVAAARLALAAGGDDDVRGELAALVAPAGPLDALVGRPWRCATCARRAAAHAWRCDGCGHWGTLKRAPIAAEADAAVPRDRRAAPRGA